ncbi:hypothetical protein HRI_004561500 [Hibiscus trionum]|uniref:Reverse transcriptase domain-containing protein n=1 Tax=Hibiscus trionum TaxID=183268 RepID=A0A9W7J9R7_HIBTR|nr:hypothetical protein HRI_004561500 [Hibiscus trionum]
MKEMRFGSRWCHWINWCISSAKISILVNGSPSNIFAISCGLRQGCPLSPFLFNLIAEGLSALLRSAMAKGFLSGLKVGCGRMKIFHIQYADDLILFSEANELYLRNTVRILRGFELVYGLKLNFSKSKLMGINLSDETVSEWANWLHCKSEKFPSPYLGLPLGQHKNSTSIWNPIVEKFKNKFMEWKSKLLSFRVQSHSD